MPEMKTLTIGGTTYTLAGGVTSVNGQTGAVVLDAEDVGAATEQDIADAIIQVLPVDSESGSIASITDGYPAPVEALSVTIKPAQDLHGQTSPYPAGGGKNQADITRLGAVTTWGVNSSGYYYGNSNYLYTAFKPSDGGFLNWLNADAVTISCTMYTPDWTSSSPWDVCPMYDDGTNGSYVGMGHYETATYKSYTFTAPTGKKIIGLGFGYGKGTVLYIKDLQIEVGSTATTFAPYSNICPISGWTEARIWCEATHDTSADPKVTVDLSGTRYGGTLDVKTGVLTVTHERVDMGTLGWYDATLNTTPCFAVAQFPAVPPSANNVLADLMCEIYELKTADALYLDKTGTNIISLNTSRTMQVRDTAYPNAASFKAGVSGAYLVYALQTPFTVQLTPAQLFDTLYGNNSVWANCGDVTVSYRADIQKYIDKKTS